MHYELILTEAGMISLVDDGDIEVWNGVDDAEFARDFEDVIFFDDMESVEEYLREEGFLEDDDTVEYIDEADEPDDFEDDGTDNTVN